MKHIRATRLSCEPAHETQPRPQREPPNETCLSSTVRIPATLFGENRSGSSCRASGASAPRSQQRAPCGPCRAVAQTAWRRPTCRRPTPGQSVSEKVGVSARSTCAKEDVGWLTHSREQTRGGRLISRDMSHFGHCEHSLLPDRCFVDESD